MIACNCALLLGLLARHDRVSSNVVASLPEILVCVIPLQLVIAFFQYFLFTNSLMLSL